MDLGAILYGFDAILIDLRASNYSIISLTFDWDESYLIATHFCSVVKN